MLMHMITWKRILSDSGGLMAATVLFNTGVLCLFSFYPSGICMNTMGSFDPSQPARRQEPLLFVYWLLTAPLAMDLLRGLIPSEQRQYLQRSLISLLFCLLGGAAASFVSSFPLWCFLTVVAFCGGASLSYYWYRCLLIATNFASTGRNDSGVWIKAVGALAYCCWMMFGVLWLLVQVEVIAPWLEQLLFPVLDLTAKVSTAIVFVVGENHRGKLLDEAELRLAEASRLRAEASNMAKRQFLRWIGRE